MSETTPTPAGRRFRKLQIALSIVCGILCLLLFGLWVRSYWYGDVVYGRLSQTRPFKLASERGRINFAVSHVSPGRAGDWAFFSYSYDRPYIGTPPRGGITASPSTRGILVPHWFLIMAIAVSTYYMLRGQPWRFSLRTLLIAMTVAAAILGLVVWLVK
jgi:hypothetical protein